MNSEAETIERCQRGDRQAFVELFLAHRDGGYRYCLGMVGNQAESMDIVQEGFLAALRGIARLEARSGFAGWFYGILRHLCCASLRHRQPQVEPEILTDLPDAGPTPESATALAERRHALVICLNQLTPKQREIVVLRELEGLSYAEIALRLDVPEGTVMSRLYDARHALRRALISQRCFAAEVGP